MIKRIQNNEGKSKANCFTSKKLTIRERILRQNNMVILYVKEKHIAVSGC